MDADITMLQETWHRDTNLIPELTHFHQFLSPKKLNEKVGEGLMTLVSKTKFNAFALFSKFWSSVLTAVICISKTKNTTGYLSQFIVINTYTP